MAYKYKIRSVDLKSGTMVVEFDGVNPFNMWIPNDDNGYLTGDALDKVIQNHYPWEITQTKKLATMPNGNEIEKLVEPYPEYIPTAEDVRAERNELLRLSDWSQGKDIPDSVSSVWAVYRQELRDVPTQKGFPTKVEWPVQP